VPKYIYIVGTHGVLWCELKKFSCQLSQLVLIYDTRSSH